MFKRMKKFIQRHAPKFQLMITTIGSVITAATVGALYFTGQYWLAAGLATWAITCAAIGTIVSVQAEQVAVTA